MGNVISRNTWYSKILEWYVDTGSFIVPKKAAPELYKPQAGTREPQEITIGNCLISCSSAKISPYLAALAIEASDITLKEIIDTYDLNSADIGSLNFEWLTPPDYHTEPFYQTTSGSTVYQLDTLIRYVKASELNGKPAQLYPFNGNSMSMADLALMHSKFKENWPATAVKHAHDKLMTGKSLGDISIPGCADWLCLMTHRRHMPDEDPAAFIIRSGMIAEEVLDGKIENPLLWHDLLLNAEHDHGLSRLILDEAMLNKTLLDLTARGIASIFDDSGDPERIAETANGFFAERYSEQIAQPAFATYKVNLIFARSDYAPSPTDIEHLLEGSALSTICHSREFFGYFDVLALHDLVHMGGDFSVTIPVDSLSIVKKLIRTMDSFNAPDVAYGLTRRWVNARIRVAAMTSIGKLILNADEPALKEFFTSLNAKDSLLMVECGVFAGDLPGIPESEKPKILETYFNL